MALFLGVAGVAISHSTRILVAGLDLYVYSPTPRDISARAKSSAVQQLCEPQDGMVTLDGLNEA